MILIWLRRNCFIHQGSFSHPKQLAIQGISIAFEYFDSNSSSSHIPHELADPSLAENHGWKSPRAGFVKVDTDAANDIQTNKSGFGAIFRDVKGDVLACGCLMREVFLDPLLAEAQALLFAVKLAADMGFRFLEMEGDYLLLVKAIKSEDTPLSSWGVVVDEIKRLLSFISGWTINHVRRQVNMVAHKLARLALSERDFIVWMEDYPEILARDVAKDKELCRSFSMHAELI